MPSQAWAWEGVEDWLKQIIIMPSQAGAWEGGEDWLKRIIIMPSQAGAWEGGGWWHCKQDALHGAFSAEVVS